MNTGTETETPTVKQIRLFDYFDANTVMNDAEPEAKRDACLDFAILFALERGILISDAEKLRAALIGTIQKDGQMNPGPLSLVSWKIYIADVPAIIRSKDQIWQPISGKLTVPGRNNTKYDIVLRPHLKEDTQRMLAIGIEKKGSAYYNGENVLVEQPFFWTYAGVVLQTACRVGVQGEELPGLPMTLAFDVNAQASTDGNGKNVSGRWSPRMYLETDKETGQVTNRLDSLVRGPNDEQRFLEAIIHAGFPVHTARINRTGTVNRSNGYTPNRSATKPTSLANAGQSMSPPAMKGDPFAPTV